MITKEQKGSIIKKYAQSEKDTGSTEVQIGLITERISQISEHLKKFPKDKHSRRGLILLVGKRRSFLNYLKKNNGSSHEEIAKLIR